MATERYEIIYRFAAKKVIAHMPVANDEELIKELTRLSKEGYEILGVSKKKELREGGE